MKQFKLAATLALCAALFSANVSANVSMKEMNAPTPVYNWTGFYLGLNLGAVNHTMYVTDTEATSFNATIVQNSNPKFTGGFQLGYRQQLDLSNASGVYGIEFSADFADASFSKVYGSPFALYQLLANNTLKDVLLLQAIAGVAANRTFLFIAAGASWTHITGTTRNLDGIPFFNYFNVDKNSIGTALGIGIEYVIWNNISARVKVDVVSANTYNVHDNTDESFQIFNSAIQGTFSINYNFC